MAQSLFESTFSVTTEDIEIEFRGQRFISWLDFFLNPRRLRGSDFLMRWSQGVWSEKRIIQAINETARYFALPYGPSGTAPDRNVQEFEQYFERLEVAGLGQIKRPNLLIFRKTDQPNVQQIINDLGGVPELPFTPEDDPRMQELLARAILALESENSLWKCQQMPNYGTQLRPQKRLGGQLGLPKNAVLPTVILKEEDRDPLRSWQIQRGIAIHIWHVFYDLAFGISFDDAEDLISKGLISPTKQTFQAPGGATTKKTIYKIYYHYAYLVGESKEEPRLVADYIIDRNGHILPYVRFEGGSLTLKNKALQVLDVAAQSRRV